MHPPRPGTETSKKTAKKPAAKVPQKKRARATAVKAGARSKPVKRSSRPSVLIVHHNANKLREDGLHLGPVTDFVSQVTSLGLGADVEVHDVTDTRDLLDVFATLSAKRRSFDVVVAIGHSNTDGIRIASDNLADWGTFANYLKPFGPRRLMLVACQAGQWSGADTLFQKLPKLRRIYASPVNTSKNLATFMLAVLPYIVKVKAPRGKEVAFAQTAAIALTGRQLREWKRTTDKNNPMGNFFDLASMIADPYVRQIPGILRGFFR